MLFAGGLPNLASMFSTHPPLTERIQALDPSFRAEDYPQIDVEQVSNAVRADEVAGLAGEPVATPASALIEDSIADSIGNPTPQHLGLAHQLHTSMPEVLFKAAHSASGAYLLVLALIIDDDHAERQFNIIEGQLGDVRMLQVREYYEALRQAGARYWLPILEISFPALKRRSAEELEFLVELIRKLIEVDGEIDLREFCFARIISRHLEQAAEPTRHAGQNRVSKSAAREAAIDLIRIVADQGSDDKASQDKAFRAGMRIFGDWAKGDDDATQAGTPVERLRQALEILSKINSAGRQSLVKAVTKTVAHDNRLTMREAELLRAICATLDCPLPPIISAA
jgi:hypothetical protein